MNEQNNELTLRQELEQLKGEKQQREKISAELDRLWEIFPDVTLNDLPDEVWALVEQGESLPGAYCITLCKADAENKKAQQKNHENSLKTPPTVTSHGDNKQYFTREQVESMSRNDVRKNYSAIIESMKHWK